MTSSYCDSLKGLDKERYERKLRCSFSCRQAKKTSHWSRLTPTSSTQKHGLMIHQALLWALGSAEPEVEFPQIYIDLYLIDTPAQFTRENLKAYKSLDQSLQLLCQNESWVSLSVCWTWYRASWRLVLQWVQICLLINLHICDRKGSARDSRNARF